MRALLDVNVLIALIDPQHGWHQLALDWVEANSADGWATCPLTENGCMRVMAGSRYPFRYTFEEVGVALAETISDANHQFWADRLSILDNSAFNRSRLRGHQQITDAYLLALAVANHGRLVTFDRSIQHDAVVGCRDEHLTVL